MFGIGAPELIIIAIIALLIFGPSKLPELGKTIGKGLREFRNASSNLKDQLWQTTMNKETRTLRKVNINDLIEADGMFDILMGDKVEPRRKFIEDNALNVVNLDV